MEGPGKRKDREAVVQRLSSRTKILEEKENAVPAARREASFVDARGKRLKRCPSFGPVDGKNESRPATGISLKKTPFHVHCDEKNVAVGPTDSTARRSERRSKPSSVKTLDAASKDVVKPPSVGASKDDRLGDKENAQDARASQITRLRSLSARDNASTGERNDAGAKVSMKRSISMKSVLGGRAANSRSKIPVSSSQPPTLSRPAKQIKLDLGENKEQSEQSKKKKISEDDEKTGAKYTSKVSWKPIRFKESKSSASESSRKIMRAKSAKAVELKPPSASKKSAPSIKSASTKATKGLENEAKGSVKKSVELKIQLRAAGSVERRAGGNIVRSIEHRVGLRKALLEKSVLRNETVDLISTDTPRGELFYSTDREGRRCEPTNARSESNGSNAMRQIRDQICVTSQKQSSLHRTKQNSVSTPVDEVPSIPFPAVQTQVDTAKRDDGSDRDKALKRGNVDRFPADLAYHVEYMDDVPLVELEKEERSVRLSPHFLSEHINVEQRKIIVVFLIRLGTHCRYPSFVIYQSVKLFDVVMDRVPVETTYMQLVALAVLWITLKREGNILKLPSATSMISHARELYEDREDLLIQCEREILITVDFNVTFPDPFSLFAYYVINCKRHVDIPEGAITFAYYCGGYLIDLTLVDEELCYESSSLVASAAAELALCVTLDRSLSSARCQFWRNAIISHSSSSKRFEEKEILRLREVMVKHVLKSEEKHSRFQVVYKKYKCSRYGRISESFVEAIRKASS